tara:strand:+ start:2175 stop:2393 length:219 start_codon:yes stop_codon:yes gene_type:complete
MVDLFPKFSGLDKNVKEQISEVTSLLSDYFPNVSEKFCEAGMCSLIKMEFYARVRPEPLRKVVGVFDVNPPF